MCVRTQLGDGTTTSRNTPHSSDVLTGVCACVCACVRVCVTVCARVCVCACVGSIAIAAGLSHTCAVLAVDKSVRCWGNNGNGQV